MLGKNTIEMNQATMNAAIEHYLNTVVLKDAVTVTNVEKPHTNYSCATFTVTIEPAAKGEA